MDSFLAKCTNENFEHIAHGLSLIVPPRYFPGTYIESCNLKRKFTDTLVQAYQEKQQETITSMIKEIIEKTDINQLLINACYNGSYELAELFINLGATDLNRALGNACFNNYTKLALLLIQKGATDFNGALGSSALGSSQEAAMLMIEQGADMAHVDNDEFFLIEFSFEELYYLYQKKVERKNFGKYKELYDQCEKVEHLFLKTLENFLITNMAHIANSF